MDRRLEILTRAQLIVLIVFTAAGQFSISVTHITGFLSCGLWFYKCHATQSWNRLHWPLWIPFTAFGAASILAVATALDPLRSAEHLKRLFEMGIFFMILNTLSDPDLQTSLRALAGRIRKTAAGRLIPHPPESWPALTPRNFFTGLLILSATVSALVGIVQVMSHGISIHHRISGAMIIYMTYAGLLMQAAVVVAAYLMFRNAKSKWAWIALSAITAALVLSLTRQAWLGFGVGLGVLITFRKPLFISLLPLIAALLIWLSPAPVKERMQSLVNFQDVTLQERLSMWKVGWGIYKDYPVTGCGFHCLREVRTRYPEHFKISKNYLTVHSSLIQLAVDTGTVGVLTWLFLWVSYLRRVYRMSVGREFGPGGRTPDRWAVLASLSVVLAFLASGLFETNFYDSEVVMMTYYLMALPFISPQGRI